MQDWRGFLCHYNEIESTAVAALAPIFEFPFAVCRSCFRIIDFVLGHDHAGETRDL